GAEAMRLQDAIQFLERRPQPLVVVIIGTPTAIARQIFDQIRRVSDHEVNTLSWHRTHDGNAIAMNDLVYKRFDRFQSSSFLGLDWPLYIVERPVRLVVLREENRG